MWGGEGGGSVVGWQLGGQAGWKLEGGQWGGLSGREPEREDWVAGSVREWAGWLTGWAGACGQAVFDHPGWCQLIVPLFTSLKKHPPSPTSHWLGRCRVYER